ncbi:hypothetical protein BIFANG_02259 [Bifidobacterium angulatum DSM 20098 = JCM 7096]|uniref:Uncharacterized protein n=1 Tax=Bifidobacterium angulatum DSM 20098 = JCM 7096 TaxID=518635 RepID=C4FD76_9BIFI|nr:hypothetical protein BIFANG_02259 [Bifidobacterium angulatum DSM 20098 = JCM 7096]BAQ95630.1 hypothetical protein BBAG_0008 [Bifidobacterium angulatum DSM 20098 = JCM 7096]
MADYSAARFLLSATGGANVHPAYCKADLVLRQVCRTAQGRMMLFV